MSNSSSYIYARVPGGQILRKLLLDVKSQVVSRAKVRRFDDKFSHLSNTWTVPQIPPVEVKHCDQIAIRCVSSSSYGSTTILGRRRGRYGIQSLHAAQAFCVKTFDQACWAGLYCTKYVHS